jgi:hypothetical protein
MCGNEMASFAEAHLWINDGRGTHDNDGGVADGVAILKEETVERVEEDLAKVHVVFENDVQSSLCLLVISIQHILLNRNRRVSAYSLRSW